VQYLSDPGDQPMIEASLRMDNQAQLMRARVSVEEMEAGGVLISPLPADFFRQPEVNGLNAGLCNEEAFPDKDHGLVCGECKVLVDRFDSVYGCVCEFFSMFMVQSKYMR
jgi:hypothetical protein